MKIEDVIWLKEVFIPEHKGRMLKGKTLEAYYKAEMILRGLDKPDKRSCSCHFKSLANMVLSLLDQKSYELDKLYEESKSVSGPEGDRETNI